MTKYITAAAPFEQQVGIVDFVPELRARYLAVRISEENGAIIDSYRFDTLDFFFGMAERVRIKVAA